MTMFPHLSRISWWLLQNIWKFHPTTKKWLVNTPEEEVQHWFQWQVNVGLLCLCHHNMLTQQQDCLSKFFFVYIGSIRCDVCTGFSPGPVVFYFPTCTGKTPSSWKLPNAKLQSLKNPLRPSGWSTRNTLWHWMTCLLWQIRTGSMIRLSSHAMCICRFLSAEKIYAMNKSLRAFAKCNCSHVLFPHKVMNMYGELIMESADHKVIINAMLLTSSKDVSMLIIYLLARLMDEFH